jgi:AcrR family transcriptional regulator
MRGTRDAVQQEITRAAAVCFAEQGYRATTLDMVAARAGISKVTLYTYVSSKEELLSRLFQQTIETFRTGLRRIVEQDVPADEKLGRIVRYQVALLTGHLPFLAVFFSEEGGLPPAMTRRVAREKRAYDRAIEAVVREGIRQGRLRDLPPTLLVFAILGMCNWLYKWYRPTGGLEPGEIADAFVNVLERGYLAGESAGDPVQRALVRLEGRLARVEGLLRSRTPGARPASRRPRP